MHQKSIAEVCGAWLEVASQKPDLLIRDLPFVTSMCKTSRGIFRVSSNFIGYS